MDGRKWGFDYDSSIVARHESEKCEFVSPILTYSDMPKLQEIVRALKSAGGKSDADHKCGIHIHVGVDKHSPLSIRNLVNLMKAKEDLIYKSFAVDTSRVGYCKKMGDDFVTLVNSVRPTSFSAMSDLWYRTFNDTSRPRTAHYHQSRYHGLNLHSIFEKGHTVEFRIFNGSLHAGLIRANVIFCLAVSAQSINQKSANHAKTQTDNEKYTYRCWLLRLGLIGDEFKNVREHLMKNLSGDCAWRDARRVV